MRITHAQALYLSFSKMLKPTIVPSVWMRDRRYACLALGQLAVASVNHEEILAAGGVEALSSALDCDDEETVFNACYALNKVAMGDENHEVSASSEGRRRAGRGGGSKVARISISPGIAETEGILSYRYSNVNASYETRPSLS